MSKKKCPKCNSLNECKIAEGKSVCWCFFEDVPRELLSDPEDSCYCKSCIHKMQSKE